MNNNMDRPEGTLKGKLDAATGASVPLKVLAVDDNRTNLHILQVFLKKLGHQVLLANNGKEAVDFFLAEKPDLVLLDIMMPVMDGFEAARCIKALSRDRWTPIIFLSALNRDENLVEGLEAGADDYLTKPINFVVLEAKLRSMQRSLALQRESIDALRRIQAISDNVLDGILTANAQGTIATVNRGMCKLFGWAAEALVGGNINMLLPPDVRARHDGLVNEDPGSSPLGLLGVERELPGQRHDGSVFPMAVTVTEFTQENQRSFVCVIRDITERKQTEQKLRENARMLQEYFDHTQNEQQLALRLMEKHLHRSGLRDSRLQYKVIAAENFSGDIVAAARSPQGRFYVLLADATGHGLAAAISVLPVLALFYRMTKLDCPVSEIVFELNHQLKESMPVGRFVAATLACLDEQNRLGEIWVGGTPEALLFDRKGAVARRFVSEYLPLGIQSDEELNTEPVNFTWQEESQLLLYSDGLLEAMDSEGIQFGSTKLSAIAREYPPSERFERIDESLTAHLQDCAAQDDVSLMLVDCP